MYLPVAAEKMSQTDCFEVVPFCTFHTTKIIWKHAGLGQVVGQAVLAEASRKYSLV